MNCNYAEAHEAHMALNGECPWCGTYDPDAPLLPIKELNDRFGTDLIDDDENEGRA